MTPYRVIRQSAEGENRDIVVHAVNFEHAWHLAVMQEDYHRVLDVIIDVDKANEELALGILHRARSQFPAEDDALREACRVARQARLAKAAVLKVFEQFPRTRSTSP